MNFTKYLNKIIIQKNDLKSRKWAEAGTRFGLNIEAQYGSAINAPIFLLNHILIKGIPFAYIIRYLNDYPSFFKTLLRLISELFLIFICFCFRIKLLWICHNVDKESKQYFPLITFIRRKLISVYSKKIFVMDYLLVPYAVSEFPKHNKKIDSISFGIIEGSKKGQLQTEKMIKEFLENRKQYAYMQGLNFLSLLCLGTPSSTKSIHFDNLVKLIKYSLKYNFLIAAIVGGNFKDNKRCNTLLNGFNSSTNIFVLKEHTIFSDIFIRNQIDFYFRGYTDYSVPYTIYEAASFGKPTLALNCGFFTRNGELL